MLLYRGLQEASAAFGCPVVGGDLTNAPVLVVTVAVTGSVDGPPVLRSGARPGDEIWTTGPLGAAAHALAQLRAGTAGHPVGGAAHRRPRPRLAEGRAARLLGATAMIDVSDGLVADLGHLAESSGVRIELATDDLPLPAELVEAGLAIGADPLGWVAAGGDDHAFAATLPSDLALRAVAVLADLPEPVPFTQVGRVVAGSGVVFVDGTPPGPPGWDHFSS
jgi:thiamine-monophosphate kinase